MSFCKDCISGVRHEGQPEGKIEQIAGIECYVATPSGDYPKDKVLLYLTDIFGIPLNNSKLLADDFARNGYKVVMPDILASDPISDEIFNSGKIDIFKDWLPKHGRETWIPVLDKVVAELKKTGVKRFATTGYCFGAPPAFYLALKGESHVTVISHPSHLEVADLEEYRDGAKAPLLINSCEVDQLFPKESQAIADEVFGGGKFAPGYERTYWDGCVHGFAVRGDMSNPKVKAGKEGSFKATVEFLNKYL
ncbi:alpha/beta-hydrolase [Wolfiporia cocos MD-104 SS10]|uniref:Alpha/beta-hydrolase n=1 Tax=Wolfiporia cocos (strain MD-104) TaxID=742152 RepID=A0A2H3JZX2_WOLCO|nr:alpha/beta-hydrolase [Wolfiporia cocos MD-104 SS10]